MRCDAVRRRFDYRFSFLGLDLDELDELAQTVRVFSRKRINLFTVRDRDYGDGRTELRRSLDRELIAAGTGAEVVRVELLTQPRVLGAGFNPVSFFLGFDRADHLRCAIAEINNTYGGRRRYALGPGQRVAGPWQASFAVPKTFFVSPYLPDGAEYRFHFETRPGRRRVRAELLGRRGEPLLIATMRGDAQPLTSAALVRGLLRTPWMPMRALALIHWQAFLLRRRGVHHHPPPAADTSPC